MCSKIPVNYDLRSYYLMTSATADEIGVNRDDWRQLTDKKGTVTVQNMASVHAILKFICLTESLINWHNGWNAELVLKPLIL